MRLSAFTLLALLGLSATPAFADSGDPSDQFLNAYLAFQKAEKAEGAGNVRGAISGYSETIRQLDQLRARWPNWNPAIVTHRREKSAEGIERLQPKITQEPPPAPGGIVEPPLPGPDGPMLEEFVPPSLTGSQKPTGRNQGKRSSGNPVKDIQDQIEGLQKDLKEAQEKLSRATQEKEDLAKKYETAIKEAKATAEKFGLVQKRADLAERALKDAETTGTKADGELEALRKEATNAKRLLRQIQIERDAESELNEQFESILKSTRDRATAATKNSAEVPKRIAEMQKEIDKALREKGDVESRLAKVQEQLAKVSTERDDAVAQLTKMREASKNVEKLMADNTQLMAKLQDAEKQIVNFKAVGAEKDQKIADLTKDLTTTRQQLIEVQKQSAQYQTQMTDLRKQLDSQAHELSQVKADAAQSLAERKRLAEEVDLLRGIVLRQQKEQAVRERTKKLVLEQLQKLEISSKAVIEQIELLGSPIVKLTEREKRLFKEPQLIISENEITMTAPDGAATPSGNPPTVPPPSETSKPPVAPATPVPAIAENTKPATPAPKPQKPTPEKKTAGTKPEATPEPILKLETSDPLKELPNLAAGAPAVSAPPIEIAKDDTPKKTLPPLDSNKKGTPMEGELPTRDANETPASSHSVGKSGLAPAVPPDLVGLARDAKDQFERGNYREAEKIYLKARDKAPSNLYVLSNLGVTQFRQQKFKLAEETFKKAIAIAPEDDFSHCTLGIVYYQQGKFDDAISALTRALAINTKNATAHNYLGITASQKGWQEAALKELETAIALDPNYADAHFNLAVVFATQQPPNKEDARKHYKRAIELGAEPDTALEQIIR
jgi:tetratricopeptide (TPR) repeat protein